MNTNISLTRTERIVSWICRLTAAIVLLQTLFFKFSGAEESVYIFTRVGLEPWGRYATGVFELVAAVLLMSSCHAWLGGLLALGVMSGALASHLTVLGIAVKGDGGLLFGLSLTVLLSSAIVVFINRRRVPLLRMLNTQKV
jgi:uncharacterized membrane protein YphA (DoxX/SURF4 family)